MGGIGTVLCPVTGYQLPKRVIKFLLNVCHFYNTNRTLTLEEEELPPASSDKWAVIRTMLPQVRRARGRSKEAWPFVRHVCKRGRS